VPTKAAAPSGRELAQHTGPPSNTLAVKLRALSPFDVAEPPRVPAALVLDVAAGHRRGGPLRARTG